MIYRIHKKEEVIHHSTNLYRRTVEKMIIVLNYWMNIKIII